MHTLMTWLDQTVPAYAFLGFWALLALGAGILARRQERREARRLRWCPSCGEAMQGDLCANCDDREAVARIRAAIRLHDRGVHVFLAKPGRFVHLGSPN